MHLEDHQNTYECMHVDTTELMIQKLFVIIIVGSIGELAIPRSSEQIGPIVIGIHELAIPRSSKQIGPIVIGIHDVLTGRSDRSRVCYRFDRSIDPDDLKPSLLQIGSTNLPAAFDQCPPLLG